MSNPAEELAELREASDTVLQQSRTAQARLAPVEGQDASGSVTVRLDADGALKSVKVDFAWDRTVSVDDLPAAVLEALAQARLARLEQYGTAITQVRDEPAPRARPAPTDNPLLQRFHERLAARDGEPSAAAELVTELLADADVALAEANELLDQHADRQFTGRSNSGRVRATASGNGDIAAIDIDRGWLSGAHPANVGREITQAVLAAGERAQREGISAALRASKLVQLARLLTDQTPT